MAVQLQRMIADKKDVVETVMEVFEKGAEVLASIAGDLFPIFSIVAPVVQLALNNVESKEAEFMKASSRKGCDKKDFQCPRGRAASRRRSQRGKLTVAVSYSAS
ncbi:hypothetical protein ANANG_G00181850 [Anguilla anguilla]|uniref:Uncharacterized protein n=1 Tax=Anguilla anguilla TaxID=7936 RepID=A0A9D3M5F4_ANGAN|nr:hypothetical protein ANANG_G00181850 [Anguilla anguilla]